MPILFAQSASAVPAAAGFAGAQLAGAQLAGVQNALAGWGCCITVLALPPAGQDGRAASIAAAIA